METILKPRPLSQTQTESGETSDSEVSLNGSSNTFTVSPRISAFSLFEELQPINGDGNNNVIYCPTARFLQINPMNTVSSFELLVGPAKRPRLDTVTTTPTTSTAESLSSESAHSFQSVPSPPVATAPTMTPPPRVILKPEVKFKQPSTIFSMQEEKVKKGSTIFLPAVTIFKSLVRLFKKPKSKKYDDVVELRESESDISPPKPAEAKTIIHHTDSVEIYKERRRKFFRELKEFQYESLRSYLETIFVASKTHFDTYTSRETSIGEMMIMPGASPLIRNAPPLQKFTDMMAVAEWNGKRETIRMQARRATSDSLLTASRSRTLVLHMPPIAQLLASLPQVQKAVWSSLL